MFKKRILSLVVCIILLFIGLCIVALQQKRNLHRDPNVLMNKYYRLKTSNPIAAKQALQILLAQDANYIPALEEASQWFLRNDEKVLALPLLERLHTQLPYNKKYAFQLAYLYYDMSEWMQAQALFTQLIQQSSGVMKLAAQQAIRAMNSYIPFYQYVSEYESLLLITNTYPKPLLRTPKILDKRKQVKKTVSEYQASASNRVTRLKEQGFLALKEQKPCLAISYFSQAYKLKPEAKTAMQLGYLYNQINDKPKAYQYFKLASHSQNTKLAFQAENAMTNLAGLQTKTLPAPYFSEVFFNPFSQTRFGLTVRPLIVRLGIEQENLWHSRQYVFLRRTDDNQSQNLGQISQIYEDNVQIEGIGGQITLFPSIPIVGFLETGVAYDLIYRNRDRWRGDLRGGFMYYNEFGARPAYFDKLIFSMRYYSNLYGDITYFSRYDNNVITGIKTHQGIRLMQYHNSMVNLYATGRLIADTQRQFFNNYVEVGPGIELIPNNCFNNVRIRYEHVNGMYLPAGATPNPYDQYYTNTVVQLLFYVKF